MAIAESRNRPTEEGGVTPAMISAGHIALIESGYGSFYEKWRPEEAVKAVYLAMLRAADSGKSSEY